MANGIIISNNTVLYFEDELIELSQIGTDGKMRSVRLSENEWNELVSQINQHSGEAFVRAQDRKKYPPVQDGTYMLDGSPVPKQGYCVAITDYRFEPDADHQHTIEVLKRTHPFPGWSSAAVGVWTDPDTGEVCIDHVLIVRERKDALDTASQYNQKAIYSLHEGLVIEL